MTTASIEAPPGEDATSENFWTLDRLAEALAGLATPRATGWPSGSRIIAGIATDTRTIRPGDAFLALQGDRFDAHDFLPQAVRAGGQAVIVARVEGTAALGVPVYEVPDTLRALGALGNYRRRAWGRPVIGITGTNGKTSTKELVKAALSSVLDVHATAGNLNNRIGVPLTLLSLRDEADIAVVEMGTSEPGEIATLRGIVEPDIAIISSVAEGHLEGLGSLAGVLAEKTSIYDGVVIAIVPAAQPEVAAAAKSRARRVVAAGLDSGEVRPSRWGINDDGLGWIEIDGQTIRPPLRGAHNLRNAMLALAAARECGVSTIDAKRGIEEMPVPPMRLSLQALGKATLINDAYNANPGSTRAALELLAHAGAGRQRVAILGTMRELGPHSARLHEEIAREALGSSIDLVAGCGEFAGALDSVGAGDERVVSAPDIDELWTRLAPRLQRDALILLKASRGVRLERLVPHLTTWAYR
jgi:UDP-N-acetylmuramoyl-tripeptide--D-alanyl-D-alanine ligase